MPEASRYVEGHEPDGGVVEALCELFWKSATVADLMEIGGCSRGWASTAKSATLVPPCVCVVKNRVVVTPETVNFWYLAR